MIENMIITKTCSIYTSKLHFATVVVSYLNKQINKKKIIKTILEDNENKNIEKVVDNTGYSNEKKIIIKNINWEKSRINKIKETLAILENTKEEEVDLIVQGSNNFIAKINRLFDLWVKVNLERINKNKLKINIINCFSFDSNKDIQGILENHDYILTTKRIDEITQDMSLQKAN